MVDYYTKIELKNLFSVIDDREKKILYQTTLQLGCRVSELCSIPRIRIKSNYFKIWDEKKDEFRNCYISQKLADEIELWYWDNQSKVKPGKRMFCYYVPKTLNNWLKDYCDLANIPPEKAHMHSFRHTFIVYAFDRKWNIRSIMDQTGDTLKTLVEEYAELSPEGRQEQWISKPLFDDLNNLEDGDEQ